MSEDTGSLHSPLLAASNWKGKRQFNLQASQKAGDAISSDELQPETPGQDLADLLQFGGSEHTKAAQRLGGRHRLNQ